MLPLFSNARTVQRMPELPEVEMLGRHLNRELAGLRIGGVQVLRERSVRPHPPSALTEALLGRWFAGVDRRAKYLVFRLEPVHAGQPDVLIGHLGMTGRMYMQSPPEPLARHAVVVMDLGGRRWVFEDMRGFGRLTLDPGVLAGIGPEPLGEAFTEDAFAMGLQKSQQAIKVRLMDSSVVAGVGNIYANEALFRAGISPFRPAARLTTSEIRRLRDAVRDTLSEAIDVGSKLSLDFRGGENGLFYFGTSGERAVDPGTERFRVYDRAGQPCRRCTAPICRIVQAGRSTYYCPECQREAAAPVTKRRSAVGSPSRS
jgi:formamidopyrimidine-DNA glycosylase